MVRCTAAIRPREDALQPLKRWSDTAPSHPGGCLAAEGTEHTTIIIDATDLKAYRTAFSLDVKKVDVPARSTEPRADVPTVRGKWRHLLESKQFWIYSMLRCTECHCSLSVEAVS